MSNNVDDISLNGSEKKVERIKYEVSCGAYVVNDGKVLLVKHKNGEHWDFPKGHMEANETKQETAIREVFEETGIKIRINSNREYLTTYMPYKNVQKTVIFFEAEKIGGTLKKQENEILKLEWLGYKEALERITFDNNKELFKKFLQDKEWI